MMEELTQIFALVKEMGALGVLCFVCYLWAKERSQSRKDKE